MKKIPQFQAVSRSPMHKILLTSFIVLLIILLTNGKTEITYQAKAAEIPSQASEMAPRTEQNCESVSSGYGGCIAPEIANKQLSALSPEERFSLLLAQRKGEGSHIHNNPYGIKYGTATKKWVDNGFATVGSKALDGGHFLYFTSQDIADQAHEDLLYSSTVYAGLTVHQAMRIWTGHSDEIK